MAIPGSLADIVLKKYAKDTGNEVAYIPPVSEENHDNHDFNLGLTQSQIFEFNEAFKMISEGAETISEEKISDLFETVGYTLQESDLKWILDNTSSQKDGTYMCDMLAESFSDWKKEQLNIEDIKAVFNMLASGKKINMMSFPSSFSGEPGSNTIKDDAIKYVLSETIRRPSPYTKEEVHAVIDEVSTTNSKGINFKDFVGLFSK